MPEANYDRDFPDLKKLGFRRTSEPAYQNCIAFVVGDGKRKWWPGEYHPGWSLDYWPNGVPQEESVGAFVQALATEHFEPCLDGSREEGFEKIAIYALGAEVRHAARQEEDGTWRSKLGEDEDIEHTLDGLAGPLYGKVVAFLRRQRVGPQSVP